MTAPTTQLRAFQAAGVLVAQDVQLARALDRLAPGQSFPVLLGAALASRAIRHGHVCADLRQLRARPLVDETGAEVTHLSLPPLFEWVMELGQASLCSRGDAGAPPTPLVFDGEARLYLARYWRYQERLAATLRRRAESRYAVDPAELAPRIRRLFGGDERTTADPRQMLAAVVATAGRLTVISGGPGTGKTSTVVRVLALLVESALSAARRAPRIIMLAPTGKAAARLTESVAASRDRLPCSPQVRRAIPHEASTIHRALGYLPHAATRFRHHATNPLPADVVLVDEASMVDLALMAKLVDATLPHARLLLLGDKDQLASVEAGAILGDICNAAGTRAYSAAFAPVLTAVLGDAAAGLNLTGPEQTGPWDCVVELTRSFRFAAGGAIGRFARSVGCGDAEDALAQLDRPDDGVVLRPAWTSSGESDLEHALCSDIVAAFAEYFAAGTPAARLEALGRYRLLAAHRRGRYGAQRLNQVVEELLGQAGHLVRSRRSVQYDGRPILITENDYQLDLFNGDVGVIVRDGTELRAFFRRANGELRGFIPSRLPAHESVFAMTVHKSQGSEFDEVGLLLPPASSPVLSRELVYTAVTRAKRRVTVYGTAEVLTQAIARRVDRASGLRDALWACPPAR